MALRAGRRNRRILIQRDTGSMKDKLNKPIQNWTTLYTEYADEIPVSGAEAFRTSREMSAKTSRFIIRHIAGITTKDRIVYEGENWDIVYTRSINDSLGAIGLEILAEVKK